MPYVIEEVEFDTSATANLQKVVDAAHQLAGSDCLYRAYGQVRAAISANGTNRAEGVFAKIKPTKSGATVIRPAIPKSGKERTDLNSSTVDEIISQMKVWHEEVQKLPVPEEIEPLEDKLFVSGGRVEANRRKF